MVGVWLWWRLFSEVPRSPNRQYGRGPLALVRPGVQFSQDTRFRTLLALSGTTLPHWRGDRGAGTAPSQWMFLRSHRKSFVIAALVLARSTDTMPASISLCSTETEEFASVSSDTHTHTHPERLFVLIIHKQSLNLNSLLTSTTLASVWSYNEFPITQFYSTSSCHSFGF